MEAITRRMPSWALSLGLGLVMSPLLSSTPILQYIGWFLASLIQESGHCITALLTGHSALPAIRLDGHAAAVHGPQSRIMVFVTWAGLFYATFILRRRIVLAIPIGVLALVYPLLAFTMVGEVVHLSCGHLGELAFASYAMYCAATGGFTHGASERVAYALLGFWLFGRNLKLFIGLVTDAGARALYSENGSFGMENDLLRIAGHCSVSLPAVAFVFVLITIVVAAVSLALAIRSARLNLTVA